MADSTTHSFLTFPAEIRYKIYTYLFHNIALTISTHPPYDHINKDNHIDSRYFIPRSMDGFRYTGTSEAVTGILGTNHFIRSESQPTFEKYAWRHLLIKGPNDDDTTTTGKTPPRLPSAWRLGEGIEMPAYHDFNWIMRRRVRRLSTPWLDGLQAMEGWYVKRFMPNLESIEIVIPPAHDSEHQMDLTGHIRSGHVLSSLFTPSNQGGGVIATTGLPLTAIRLLRTEGNLFNRVRLRIQTAVMCTSASASAIGGGDGGDGRLHILRLECVVNPKTFQVVKYSRITKDKWHGDGGACHWIADLTIHEICDCDLDAFAQKYVADSSEEGVIEV